MASIKQNLRWDPKTVEIRTKAVEKSLEPLIKQVTTIVNHANRPPRRGYSKKAIQLVKELSAATLHLVEKGKQIAEDYPNMREFILEACQEVTTAGDNMEKVSEEFAYDPCDDQKRSTMVRAARSLLAAVTRLLCVADMADVQTLLDLIRKVEGHLKSIVNVDELKDFLEKFNNYGVDLHQLLKRAAQRQADLKNQIFKDDIAAGRASLRSSSRLLYTASKAHLTHTDSSHALENRDYSINQLDEALTSISAAVQAYGEGSPHPFEVKGDLLQLFEDILDRCDRESGDFQQKALQKEIRSLVEEATERSAHVGETVGDCDDVKEKMNEACRNTNKALLALLESCTGTRKSSVSGGAPLDIDSAKASLQRNSIELSKLVRDCLAGSIADTFLRTDAPLVSLIEAAEAGDIEETDSRSVIFLGHNAKIVEVSNTACTMAADPEKIKIVRLCAGKLSEIGEQVSHAAKTTADHPGSAFAKENMYLLRDMWLQQVKILTEAVDDITNIDDYLKACEKRIKADTNRAVDAMQQKNVTEVHRAAITIRMRVKRADDVIMADIEDNKPPAPYVVKVKKCLTQFKANDLSHFLNHINYVVKSADGSPVDDKAFRESTRQVYKGFRNLRRTVRRRNPNASVSDSETDEEEEIIEVAEQVAEVVAFNEKPDVDYYLPTAKTASTLMKTLTSEQKKNLNTLVEGLTVDKERLLSEVSKWEEQGNEIIVLAKKMCMIMMDLSDFTRGTGPLRSGMDVINAVERIAKYGNQMTKLVNQVSIECPQSHTRSDLVAYIHQIALYSHQLKLTAKVKADVQMIGGEQVWTAIGAETAKSLIETARNLMSSVMLTVRACYIASTKHRSTSMTSSTVNWHMTAPDKISLIDFNAPESASGEFTNEAALQMNTLDTVFH